MNRFLFILAHLFLILCFFQCRKKDDQSPAPNPPPPPPAVKNVPKLITTDVVDMTTYSLVVGGKLVDSGGSAVTEMGIVVDTISKPTIEKNLNKFKVQITTDSFSRKIVSFNPNTTYYFRAYAINKEGAGYGNEVKVTTPRDNPLGVSEVFLSSQREVDSFGAKNYSFVSRLIIQGDVYNLKPLNSIQLFGSLEIRNTQLTDLDGLQNVEAIGVLSGELRIHHNKKLVSLKGLEKIQVIHGNFYVYNDSSLVDLNGLNNLVLIDALGDVSIFECPNLQSLNGLERLRFIDNWFTIQSNDKLVDVGGLKSLEWVYGWITFKNNASLPDLNGLASLRLAAGLQIFNNPSLENIMGLGNLDTLDRTAMPAIIDIRGNNKLKSLKGLEKIRNVEYINIDGNSALTDLQGFSSSLRVSANIGVYNNGALLSLKGLEGIKNAAKIYVTDNRSLADFCALKPFFQINSSIPFTVSGNAVNPNAATILQACP